MNNLTSVQLSNTSHSLYIFGLCGLLLLAMETKGDNLPQPEILNNFVSQLLRTRLDNAIDSEGISVSNPRDGWVHFRLERQPGKDGSIEVQLAGATSQTTVIRCDGTKAGQTEAMRYLPQGTHTVFVSGTTKGSTLTVRAIPELIFSSYPGNPTIKEFGSYDWPYLRRIGMLDSVNVIIGAGEGDHVAPWLDQGKHLIHSASVPGRHGKALTVEQAYEFWVDHPGLVKEQFSGIIVDEFDERVADNFPVYAEAIGKVMQNRKGRGFYPYMHGDAKLLAPFVKPSMQTDCKFAYLRYQKEQPSEEQAREHINKQLIQDLLELDQAAPGVINKMIVVLGLLSAPPLSLNANPAASYKVYMDMQFHALATDPDLRGLYGIEQWSSAYADEDYLRWAAKLFRHYCVEGRTDRLTNDPYLLDHIRNPDFEQGLDDWSVQTAEPGSVAAKTSEGLGWLQGRWPQDPVGDTLVWTRRSPHKPNTISQTIRNLQPGRTYSAKVFFGDFTDLTEPRQDAVSLRINGAETITDRSFNTVFTKRSSHVSPRFGGPEGYFGFARQVFRATSETAQLVISDWVLDSEPGGPAGQEMMINFIEVEPYLMEE